MRTIGGKYYTRHSIIKAILDNDNNRNRFIEPFCGAAWITKLATAHYATVEASDANPDLIEYWKAIQAGWIPPEIVTAAEHANARAGLPPYNEPSAQRAHILQNSSYAGIWAGTYQGPTLRRDRRETRETKRASNRAGENSRRDKKDAHLLAGVQFAHQNYTTITASPGDTIYCDPPYAGTTGYTATGAFNTSAFWETAQQWANHGVNVFVSEYVAPQTPTIQRVWSQEVNVSSGQQKPNQKQRKAIENLYKIHPQVRATR